jgi:Ca2+-binding RTX toxin-like protein
MKMKKLFALSALAVLGVVSYLMLADDIPCHLLPKDSKTCAGTSRSDNITLLAGDVALATKIDTINGDAGNDRITVDYRYGQKLTINGGEGKDSIFSGNQNDTLNGDAGNDRIYGNGGNDTINGGEGNDLIVGGRGQDTLIGGGGNDTFILRREDAEGKVENITCTQNASDRGVIRLIGFSKHDLSVQGLRQGPLPQSQIVTISDGTSKGQFEIQTGPGRCLIVLG